MKKKILLVVVGLALPLVMGCNSMTEPAPRKEECRSGYSVATGQKCTE